MQSRLASPQRGNELQDAQAEGNTAEHHVQRHAAKGIAVPDLHPAQIALTKDERIRSEPSNEPRLELDTPAGQSQRVVDGEETEQYRDHARDPPEDTQ